MSTSVVQVDERKRRARIADRLRSPQVPRGGPADGEDLPRGPAGERARSLLLPIGGVTGILLLCKLAGFGEKIVVAHFLGTSWQADGYYAAFAVVWAIVFIVRELLQPACLPVYVQARQSDPKWADGMLTAVGLVLAVGLALAAVALALWPGSFVAAVAPGFDDAARAHTAGLLRTMSAGVALAALMGLTRTALNAHRQFCWAAAGELAFRGVVVGALLAGFVLVGGNYIGVALAAGATAGLALHVAVLRRQVVLRWPGRDPRVRGSLRQVTVLAAPLMVGVLCSHFGQLIDGVLASTLSEGRLSALTYARKLTDAIVLLGPAAVATVLFAHFAALAAAGRCDEMRHLLIRCIRVLLILAVPVAVLVVGLRYSVVRVLFEHGRFGGASTDLTASALAAYGPGIVAFSLDGLLVAAFYAMKDMKTPVLVGVVGVAADTALAWMLMQWLDHVGIAASISVVKTVKVVVLFGLLSRRLGMPAGGDVLRLLLGIAVASTVMIAVMLCALAGWDGLFSMPGRFAEVLRAGMVAVAGSAAFAVVLWILGVAEVRQAAGWLTGRVRMMPGPAEIVAGERDV